MIIPENLQSKLDLNQVIEEVLIDDGCVLNMVEENDDEKIKYMDSVVAFMSKSFDLIRSVLIRVVFAVHLFIAIILVCFVRNDSWYFVNFVGIVFIVIEWFAIAMKNGNFMNNVKFIFSNYCIFLL